jgi:FliI/YscN family ATPase
MTHPVNEEVVGSKLIARIQSGLRDLQLVQHRGKVIQIIGLVIESQGPRAAIGEICRLESANNPEGIMAEVVGFRNQNLLLMPLGQMEGVYPGCEVLATGGSLKIPVGEELLGRVLDGLGKPLDGLPEPARFESTDLKRSVPHPLTRARIDQAFQTGIRAVDTFVPIGVGQRLGIFSGSGVGKSTMLAMMASQGDADVNIIALIGERGREVREFIERDLGEEGKKKSIVVVATSDEPALARVKGAFLAMAMGEYFRRQGKKVLMMMDSVTRFAMAQREIGLAIGEPPSSRGYTPSVFALLPRLLERAGTDKTGSITGLFTVLVEGDDMNDPIADSVRSILDGHLVLTRELATQNHYPAVDILQSNSRLARDLLSTEQLERSGKARDLLAIYQKNQDLINIGAYQAGSNSRVDASMRAYDPLMSFLRQNVDDAPQAESTWEQLGHVLAQAYPTQKEGVSESRSMNSATTKT